MLPLFVRKILFFELFVSVLSLYTIASHAGVKHSVRPCKPAIKAGNDSEITIFPNPFKDHFSVEISNTPGPVFIKVFDLIGTEVGFVELQEKSAHNVYVVKLDHLTSGVYFCNFYANSKLLAVKKLTCIR